MKNSNGIGKDNYSVWLKFAEEDMVSAKALLERKIYNQVCFHSQQAVEKMLKAYLKSKKIMPPKIHSLLELLQMCSEEDDTFSWLQEACRYLSRFYLSARYPDALPGNLPNGLPNKDEARKSLEFAEEVEKFMKRKLSLRTPKGAKPACRQAGNDEWKTRRLR